MNLGLPARWSRESRRRVRRRSQSRHRFMVPIHGTKAEEAFQDESDMVMACCAIYFPNE